MKVREPKDKNLISIPEQRSARPSDDLPPLKKYEQGENYRKRDEWFKLAHQYLRAFLAEGRSRTEIKNIMNIDDPMYDRLESEMVDKDAGKLATMGTAHRYYIYAVQIEQCIRQLDDYIYHHTKDEGRNSGVVGAIKAKAQLCKDVLTTGQDLGIISKRAKEVRVLGEINLATLDTEELQDLLLEKMKTFTEIVGRPPELPAHFERILDNESRNATTESEEVIEAKFVETRH